ncbi:MAG TPA: hypothetical protein EYP58_00850 [bacterium (Candidatus Stahlbacteria)]|nr:hypothetical protein [Candidatus Stahlbacteria bacterium]
MAKIRKDYEANVISYTFIHRFYFIIGLVLLFFIFQSWKINVPIWGVVYPVLILLFANLLVRLRQNHFVVIATLDTLALVVFTVYLNNFLEFLLPLLFLIAIYYGQRFGLMIELYITIIPIILFLPQVSGYFYIEIALFFLVNFALGLIFEKQLTSLGAIKDSLKSNLEGDLSSQIARDRDIYADLSEMLNQVVGSFADIAFNTRTLSKELSTLAQELASSSEELSAASEEITGSVQGISQAAGREAELVSDVFQVSKDAAKKSSESDQFAGSALDFALDMTKTAKASGEGSRRIMEGIDLISKKAKEQGELIESLRSSSLEIGKILETISMIGKRTNILALNASIEAARAGESGRGFAVVAQEVRRLAQHSSQAVRDIYRIIDQMQNAIEYIVIGFDEVAKAVESGSDAISSSITDIAELITSATKVKEKLEKMKEGISEQREELEAIAGSMEEISCITSENAASTEEISASIEESTTVIQELNQHAQRLSEMSRSLLSYTERLKI